MSNIHIGGGGGGESISMNSNSSSNCSRSSCSSNSSSSNSSTWKYAGGRHITNADLLYGILSSAYKQDLRLMSTTDTSKNTPSTSIVSEF